MTAPLNLPIEVKPSLVPLVPRYLSFCNPGPLVLGRGTKGCLILKVYVPLQSNDMCSKIFWKGMSRIYNHLCRQWQKILFARKDNSSNYSWVWPSNDCWAWRIIDCWRLSSTKGPLLPKVVFHGRSSTIEDCLPPKVVFHRRSSSIEGCLPPTTISASSFA